MNARKNPVAAKLAILAIQAGALLICLRALLQADSATPASRSIQVSTVGLDLNTAAGARAFYSRLDTAAETVCGRESQGDPIYGRQFEICHRDTLRMAVHAVNRPLVTQRYNERQGTAEAATSEDPSPIRIAAK